MFTGVAEPKFFLELTYMCMDWGEWLGSYAPYLLFSLR